MSEFVVARWGHLLYLFRRLATRKMYHRRNPLANPRLKTLFPPTEKKNKKDLYVILLKEKISKEKNPRRKRYRYTKFR